MTTHKVKLSITDMVYTRLPFLIESVNNDEIISGFIIEVMSELEVCFKKGLNEFEGEDWDENQYNLTQKSIIADLVCVYILMLKMLSNVGGSGATEGSEEVAPAKFLKSAKAGSVEVEWEQFDLNKASLALSGKSFLESYKKSAARKAASLGCLIDITDEYGVMIQDALDTTTLPFRIVHFQSCGWGNDDIVERG